MLVAVAMTGPNEMTPVENACVAAAVGAAITTFAPPLNEELQLTTVHSSHEPETRHEI